MAHHGDALWRWVGGTGDAVWAGGNITVVRGQYQLMAYHKPDGSNQWHTENENPLLKAADVVRVVEQVTRTNPLSSKMNLTLLEQALKSWRRSHRKNPITAKDVYRRLNDLKGQPGTRTNLKETLLEDSLAHGYLLPGFMPLHWRAMCHWEPPSGNLLECAFQTCKCKKAGHCYFDELCPKPFQGEPFQGLGCYTDADGKPCRECGYGDFDKVPCT